VSSVPFADNSPDSLLPKADATLSRTPPLATNEIVPAARSGVITVGSPAPAVETCVSVSAPCAFGE
jgi:hypothetical protein